MFLHDQLQKYTEKSFHFTLRLRTIIAVIIVVPFICSYVSASEVVSSSSFMPALQCDLSGASRAWQHGSWLVVIVWYDLHVGLALFYSSRLVVEFSPECVCKSTTGVVLYWLKRARPRSSQSSGFSSVWCNHPKLASNWNGGSVVGKLARSWDRAWKLKEEYLSRHP